MKTETKLVFWVTKHGDTIDGLVCRDGKSSLIGLVISNM